MLNLLSISVSETFWTTRTAANRSFIRYVRALRPKRLCSAYIISRCDAGIRKPGEKKGELVVIEIVCPSARSVYVSSSPFVSLKLPCELGVLRLVDFRRAALRHGCTRSHHVIRSEPDEVNSRADLDHDHAVHPDELVSERIGTNRLTDSNRSK